MSDKKPPLLYWIEDEIDLFDGLRDELEDARFSIIPITTVSQALQCLDEIEAKPGTVVLDLWLPPGNSSTVPQKHRGPKLGLWLLNQIQDKLGRSWPILILSGNLTADILATLQREHGIVEDRLFAKPLIEADRFIRTIRECHKGLLPGSDHSAK
jgi:DNA-binding response OmpR family regulator